MNRYERHYNGTGYVPHVLKSTRRKETSACQTSVGQHDEISHGVKTMSSNYKSMRLIADVD